METKLHDKIKESRAQVIISYLGYVKSKYQWYQKVLYFRNFEIQKKFRLISNL